MKQCSFMQFLCQVTIDLTINIIKFKCMQCFLPLTSNSSACNIFEQFHNHSSFTKNENNLNWKRTSRLNSRNNSTDFTNLIRVVYTSYSSIEQLVGFYDCELSALPPTSVTANSLHYHQRIVNRFFSQQNSLGSSIKPNHQ